MSDLSSKAMTTSEIASRLRNVANLDRSASPLLTRLAADEIERLQKLVDHDNEMLRERNSRVALLESLVNRTAHEPPAALEVQNAIAYLRTIELACDARDDRQSVTYIGEIRALLHRLSRASQPPSDALREAVQILENGKELGSVFHLRGAIIQALMKLHEQHPDAWPSPTKEVKP